MTKIPLRFMFGVIIIGSAILFVLRLYWHAPWSFDLVAYIIQPSLLFALPLNIIGLYFCMSPRAVVPPLWLGLWCSLLGSGMVWFIGPSFWPATGLPTTWEDSGQTLFVLEIMLLYLGIPLWSYHLYLGLTWVRKHWRTR